MTNIDGKVFDSLSDIYDSSVDYFNDKTDTSTDDIELTDTMLVDLSEQYQKFYSKGASDMEKCPMTHMAIDKLQWRKSVRAKMAQDRLTALGLFDLDDILDWETRELYKKVTKEKYVWEELCYALTNSGITLNEDWRLFVARTIRPPFEIKSLI